MCEQHFTLAQTKDVFTLILFFSQPALCFIYNLATDLLLSCSRWNREEVNVMMVPQLFLCNCVFPDFTGNFTALGWRKKKNKNGKKIREDVEIKNNCMTPHSVTFCYLFCLMGMLVGRTAFMISYKIAGLATCGAKAERPPSIWQRVLWFLTSAGILGSQLCLQTLGRFPVGALTRHARVPYLAALQPRKALCRLRSSQLKHSVLPSHGRSVNCLHFIGRRPRQTWNKAHEKERAERALDLHRRRGTVGGAEAQGWLTNTRLSVIGRTREGFWPVIKSMCLTRSYLCMLSL